MRLVYIAGYGHSGSTIYSILLGDSEGAFNLGEFVVWPVWLNSSAALRQAEAYPEIVKGLDGLLARSEGWRWNDAYQLVATATGARTLIDSSKTAINNLSHAMTLEREGLDIDIVHIVRDPRRVARSLATKHKSSRAPLKAIVAWTITNVATWWRYSNKRYIISFYEDFCRAPEVEIGRIGDLLSIDVERVVKNVKDGNEVNVGLQVNGNRFARSDKVRVATDLNNSPGLGVPEIVGSLVLPVYWFLRTQKRLRP